MRRVLVTISVQVAAMWITFNVVWDDGEAEHRNQFGLWFPNTANVGTIRLKLIIRLNPATDNVSAEISMQARRGLDHFPDDEIEMV